jgi:2-polyprenyl-3-methyl-5-hydroxy-6-metoxy-1,4-benzoquinol methylase
VLHEITESNRASWNQIHAARPGQPASFFASGGSVLDEDELALAGDVNGKRVLQLACSCGDEALSWAQAGACVTGVDISEVAITMAREKSAAAGIPVDFRRADMLDLPADLAGLDLVYLSWGAICWVPDLTVFARLVADRLSPGGSVLVAEHHPVWEVLAVRGTNQLTVTADYFGRSTPRATIDNAKLPTGARDSPVAPDFTAFVWPPSDIIMSFLAAGLRLTAFHEGGSADMYPGLGEVAAHLPATYLIKATRDVSCETSRHVSK